MVLDFHSCGVPPAQNTNNQARSTTAIPATPLNDVVFRIPVGMCVEEKKDKEEKSLVPGLSALSQRVDILSERTSRSSSDRIGASSVQFSSVQFSSAELERSDALFLNFKNATRTLLVARFILNSTTNRSIVLSLPLADPLAH